MDAKERYARLRFPPCKRERGGKKSERGEEEKGRKFLPLTRACTPTQGRVTKRKRGSRVMEKRTSSARR